MSRSNLDLSLYLIVDPDACRAFGVEVLLDQAIEGGVTAVQLRQKHASTRRMIEAAVQVRGVLAKKHIPLIVNDRVDVALAAGADGVHVGQDDMTAGEARRLVGPGAIVGLSLWAVEQTEAIEPGLVDYVGIGPVFPTSGKADAVTPIGLEGFTAIRSRVDVPAVAIGGMDAPRAELVTRAGADGVAVITAICFAPDPGSAARALAEAVRRGRSAAVAP